MRPFIRPIFIVAATVFTTSLGAQDNPAAHDRARIEAIVKNYLAQNPEEVQRIVKDYLIKNPQVMQEALDSMIKSRRLGTANPDRVAAIRSNAGLLLNSPRHVTLGNPRGDVTVVEFVDYNCGFCKRALADMVTLLKDDPNIKFVVKEFPVLGAGSVEAAQIAVAARMQDTSGEKYLAFHQKLMGERGPANRERARAAAQEAGFDLARIERDMMSDEVSASLAEARKLASALGINGTPGYVIGDAVIPGAVGITALKARIQSVRNQSPPGIE